MKFDPETYLITIRKEEIDDEILYVGRVAEFPNISVYEEDFVTARRCGSVRECHQDRALLDGTSQDSRALPFLSRRDSRLDCVDR